jgi:hypothetical protein
MLFIDSTGLRTVAGQLTDLREELVPNDAAATVSTGFPGLNAACAEFAAALQTARMAGASCVDRLGSGLLTAANRWDSADEAPAR